MIHLFALFVRRLLVMAAMMAVLLSAPYAYANTEEASDIAETSDMSATDSGSFSTALEHTYEHNPELLAKRAEQRALDEKAFQAFSGWLPNITAQYSRGVEDRKFGNQPSDSIDTDTRSLSLSQSLFSGGKTHYASEQADQIIAAGQANLLATEQQVLLSAITAYADMYRDTQTQQFYLNNVAVLEKHLDVTKKRFELGEVTKTDVAQSQARLAMARAEAKRAEGTVLTTKSRFTRITQTEPNVSALPPLPTDLPEGFDRLLATARKQHPSLIAANYNVEAAKSQIGVNRAALLPSLELNGNTQRAEGQVFGGGSTIDSSAVTLNLSIPLYQSGTSYSSVREAKENVTRYQQEQTHAEQWVQEMATEAWQNYQTAKVNSSSTLEAVTAAETALQGVIKEAQAGSRTTLDILDAEQELLSARILHLNALHDHTVSAYQLLLTEGQLTAKHLALNVTYYDPKAHLDEVRYQLIGY